MGACDYVDKVVGRPSTITEASEHTIPSLIRKMRSARAAIADKEYKDLIYYMEKLRLLDLDVKNGTWSDRHFLDAKIKDITSKISSIAGGFAQKIATAQKIADSILFNIDRVS